MAKKSYNAQLKKYCLAQGIDLFGVADIEKIKKDFLISPNLQEKLNCAVSLGVRLSGGVLEEIKNAPTRLYFHHYRTANVYLDQAALKIAHFIERKNYLAVPIPASQIVDWEKQTGHLSHKHIGVLAGLGWIGRNNLLVNKNLGCHFRLATILTDMPLKADQASKDSCAGCRLCVEVCPAGAIKEKPEDFSHLVCFEKLKEFQKKRLTDQYICGVCVNACRGGK
ncbi:MAG: 4Fe-4S binding protein [Candidatus Omnitrophica bacterium]|nr:4Fe-4S binding protein [Candidatus Omnitrophota bacterium]MDD5653315.1 4Fe-4S binding protein [Candidatus Omnitrophota bacterium]